MSNPVLDNLADKANRLPLLPGVYIMLDEQAWLEYVNQDDPVIIEALRVFKDGEAFPKNP